MGVSHRRGMLRLPVAGLPDGETDEALIGLVQSLPYGSPQRAAAYEELVRRSRRRGSQDCRTGRARAAA
jgi:hypothetical protein